MFKNINIVNIGIVFFILLILYQIFANVGEIEGMENTSTTAEYQDYNQDDPLILSKQNAANIDVLKGRVDELGDVKKKVDDLGLNVDNINDQILQLMQQQEDLINSSVGDKPLEVTGTSEEEEETTTE